MNSPPRLLSWETTFFGANFVFLRHYPGGHVPGHYPVNPPPEKNTLEHLTNYWGAIYPGRCPGISWYLCTYNDTYWISCYTKVCLHYSMFLYLCLQYVPRYSTKIFQGTLALWDTRHLCRKWSTTITNTSEMVPLLVCPSCVLQYVAFYFLLFTIFWYSLFSLACILHCWD